MQDKIEPLKTEYSCNDKFKFQFRIGQSQKLLNMLLKYYWGMGWLKKHPPHCPIDRNILEEKKLKNNESKKWKECNAKLDKNG